MDHLLGNSSVPDSEVGVGGIKMSKTWADLRSGAYHLGDYWNILSVR